MPIFNRSSGRTAIDVSEANDIADRVAARDPNAMTRADMQSLLGASALVLDGLRRRPHYFDGRFLTGADLTRDQDYVRQRQGDLALHDAFGGVIAPQRLADKIVRTGIAHVLDDAGLDIAQVDKPARQGLRVRSLRAGQTKTG